MKAADQLKESNRLVEARTRQLRSAAAMNDVLIQALKEIKARADQALNEAEAIRKAEMDRTT